MPTKLVIASVSGGDIILILNVMELIRGEMNVIIFSNTT